MPCPHVEPRPYAASYLCTVIAWPLHHDCIQTHTLPQVHADNNRDIYFHNPEFALANFYTDTPGPQLDSGHAYHAKGRIMPLERAPDDFLRGDDPQFTALRKVCTLCARLLAQLCTAGAAVVQAGAALTSRLPLREHVCGNVDIILRSLSMKCAGAHHVCALSGTAAPRQRVHHGC